MKRYLDISVELLKKKGKNYFAGANSVVPRTASVTETIIWDNVEVDPGARIHRCILGDNVRLEKNEVIENSVIVRRELVEGKMPPEKALPGYLYGENFIVSL